MSGFTLRALLEDTDFTSSLQPNKIGYNTGKPTDDASQKLKFDEPVHPVNSALLNQNIWSNVPGGDGEDFNLEYMDLDEFLSETGLVDTNFSNILGSNAVPSPTTHTSPTPSPTENKAQGPTLEELLVQSSSTPSPCSSSNSANELVTPVQDVLPTKNFSNTESASTPDDEPTPTVPTTDCTDIGVVKKRKYKEDGEGLSDTAVVVVPGKEGFDPAHVKFDPDELKPQPIIKKSKKQFVADENKDEKYWRRRNKNNVAAKRSREARRAKENQIIMRAGYLEQENEKLTQENNQLMQENQELKRLVEQLQGKK